MVTASKILEWCETDREETWLEFKRDLSVAPSKIAASICSMINLEDDEHPQRYIVFGIGEKDDSSGIRRRTSILLADPDVAKKLENMLSHVCREVKPSIRLKDPVPVKVEDDWTVLVLEVEEPASAGQRLRLYDDRAFIRGPKPERMCMDSEAIWAFHKKRLRREVEKQFVQEMGKSLQNCLAELAFVISEDRCENIEEDLIGSISQNHRATGDELLREAVEKHHLLRPHPSGGYSFVSPSVQSLYAAFYLKQLSNDEIGKYLLDPDWEQTILTLAEFSGRGQLEQIVNHFFDKGRPLTAIECFCKRGAEVQVAPSLRSRLLSEIKLLRDSRSKNQYAWITALDLLGRSLLGDADDTARIEVLHYLEGMALPLQFVQNLMVRLDPAIESNDQIRSRLCRLVGQSRLGPIERLGLIPAFVGFADAPGNRQNFDVFESLLLAIYRLSLGTESKILPSVAKSIGRLVEEWDSEYAATGTRRISMVARATSRLQRLARGELHAK